MEWGVLMCAGRWLKEARRWLKEADVSLKEDNDERVNPNGGAIAVGHPLGMTSARITYSAALELQKTGKRYALAIMCIGVGQGYAIVLERA